MPDDDKYPAYVTITLSVTVRERDADAARQWLLDALGEDGCPPHVSRTEQRSATVGEYERYEDIYEPPGGYPSWRRPKPPN